MSALARYCPLCDAMTDAAVCGVHAVPTVAASHVNEVDHLPPGTSLLGRYVVEERIGHGGMGAVYRGRQQPFGRPVALKTILPRLARSGSHLRRFYKEGDALHRLSHPNIVRVFEFGVDDATGVALLVMELVAGDPLSARFAPGRGLPEHIAARLLAPVASALAEAHAVGVVHRDLKPANILVRRLSDGEDEVKVVDFGLARVSDEGLTATGPTTAGYVVGTPAYLSPEQVTQAPCDHRADLYALGCVLFEALAGEPPFRGEALQVLSQHIGSAHPPLPFLLADGRPPSHEMRQLVDALLAKSPADRPSDAGDVARRLKALATRGPKLADSAAPAAPGAIDPPLVHADPRTDRASRRPWSIALGAVLAALAAVLAVQAVPPTPPEVTPIAVGALAAPALAPGRPVLSAAASAPHSVTKPPVVATDTAPPAFPPSPETTVAKPRASGRPTAEAPRRPAMEWWDRGATPAPAPK